MRTTCLSERLSALISQDPDVTCTLLGSAALPEVGIHREVVADAVLPSVVLCLVVRKVVCDPLVDLRHGEGRLVSQGESDQVSVGVVWFVA